MRAYSELQEAAALRVPRVVTIVLNWNGWTDTIECLQSLFAIRYPNHRIVVCDNGSQDESLDKLQNWSACEGIAFEAFESPAHALREQRESPPFVTFIQTGANLGYGGGNNVGVRYALERLGADYVWILNNDTVVDAGALGEMVRLAQAHADVAIVGSKLLRYGDAKRIQALGGGRLAPFFARDTQLGRGRTDRPANDNVIDLQHVVGASMLVSAEAVRDVGLLDESYFLYREETDWCIRMRRSGWRLMYCPHSIVRHKEGRSAGFKSVIHDYYSVRNMLFLIRRHYPEAIFTAVVASFCYTVAPKLARRQFGRLRVVLRAYMDFFRGLRGKQLSPDELYAAVRARPLPRAQGSSQDDRVLIPD